MKLYERFKTIDHGIPVPLKIPVSSCLKGFRNYFIAIVCIFVVTCFMTWANWIAFKGYVPVELTKDEVKAKTQACYEKKMKVKFLYDENYKVYHVRCTK
jgi:hypothetical protein